MPSFIRVIIAFALLTLLMVSTTNLAIADDDKPQVFINTASSLGYLASTNYGTTRFAQIVQAKGFDIDHGVHPDLVTNSPLDGIDVYVFFAPNFPFTDADKIALRQWVRAGGILITSDYLGESKISRFLEEFGVEMSPWVPIARDLYLPSNSPLAGPLSISNGSTKQGLTGKILDSTRSEVIIRYDDGTVAMSRTISHAGKGEIIAIPCLPILFDNTIGGDINSADNDKIVQNLFSYIYNRIKGTTDGNDDSYDLTLLKVKFKKGTVFVPGEEIKMIARIRNIGTAVSEDTRVAFYLKSVGSVPSATFEVASATVAEIKAKKKIKIVKKTFLPEDLDPGTYEVIAVVDPDELTDDANTSNNSATAKKEIIIQ